MCRGEGGGSGTPALLPHVTPGLLPAPTGLLVSLQGRKQSRATQWYEEGGCQWPRLREGSTRATPWDEQGCRASAEPHPLSACGHLEGLMDAASGQLEGERLRASPGHGAQGLPPSPPLHRSRAWAPPSSSHFTCRTPQPPGPSWGCCSASCTTRCSTPCPGPSSRYWGFLAGRGSREGQAGPWLDAGQALQVLVRGWAWLTSCSTAPAADQAVAQQGISTVEPAWLWGGRAG